MRRLQPAAACALELVGERVGGILDEGDEVVGSSAVTVAVSRLTTTT